ncbi:MAG: ATP-binding protein [Deltaproteobacteria bacterium]|nr:ATP-binding protein [Deltaproteobacteria bacterium]
MYRPRELAAAVREALETVPVVVITGMRQTGKSTFLERDPLFAGWRRASLDDLAQLAAARTSPQSFVEADEPLAIDEAQRCPELLLAIKARVDGDRRPGRFVLSGSASFALLHDVTESLAGRAVYFDLHPFTRRELAGRLRDEPLLRTLFDGGTVGRPRGRRVTSREVLLGGLPPVCLGLARHPEIWFRGYEQTYLERDVRDLGRIGDLVAFRTLLHLAALRTAQVLNQSDLGRDAKLNAMTAGRYLGVMEASFVLARLAPFLANRASRVIKSPKLFVGDSGLACHLAGVERLATGDGEPLRGALYETYVAHNLAALLASRWPRARLHYWGVQGRHEVDFVIDAGRGCLAIEVKTADRFNERDLTGLRAFLAATPQCRAAVLAYNGTQSLPLGDRLWALPIDVALS